MQGRDEVEDDNDEELDYAGHELNNNEQGRGRGRGRGQGRRRGRGRGSRQGRGEGADSSQARPRRGRRQLVPEENAAQNQANHEEQLVVMLYI